MTFSPFSAPQPPFPCAYLFSFCSPPFILQELLECISEDSPSTAEGKGIHPCGENHAGSTKKGPALGFEPGTILLQDCLHHVATLNLVNSSMTRRYFFLIHINFNIPQSLSLPSLSPLPRPSPRFFSSTLKF